MMDVCSWSENWVWLLLRIKVQFEMLDFIYDGSMFNSIETTDSIYVMGLQGKVFRTDKRLKHWQQISIDHLRY